MGTAASSFLNPIAAEHVDVSSARSPKELARRAIQRRQIQAMIGASYFVDALVLLIYAHAGTIPLSIGPAYAATGLSSVVLYTMLSELGVNDRFKDHYMVAPQSTVSMAIMIAFVYVAPEAGVMFLCTLFTVFAFS